MYKRGKGLFTENLSLRAGLLLQPFRDPNPGGTPVQFMYGPDNETVYLAVAEGDIISLSVDYYPQGEDRTIRAFVVTTSQGVGGSQEFNVIDGQSADPNACTRTKEVLPGSNKNLAFFTDSEGDTPFRVEVAGDTPRVNDGGAVITIYQRKPATGQPAVVTADEYRDDIRYGIAEQLVRIVLVTEEEQQRRVNEIEHTTVKPVEEPGGDHTVDC